MNFTAPCGNTEPHEFHNYQMPFVKDCTGKTACGEILHPPHTMPSERIAWCRGLCGCGATYLPKDHGLGEHK